MSVTFCTMNSHSELSTESSGNYWIVRFGNDGRISYWRNLRQVEKLPVTTLTKQLEYCAQELQHKIRAYQVESDEQAKRLLWWDIKEWLANYNTATEHGLVPLGSEDMNTEKTLLAMHNENRAWADAYKKTLTKG